MPEPCHGVFPLQGGRQWCSGEVDAVRREHPWVTRSKVSSGKSFFLLNLDAKMLLGRGRGRSKAGMLDPTESGRGWGHSQGLQAVVKTAVLLQWQGLSRWAAWLEPPTLL